MCPPNRTVSCCRFWRLLHVLASPMPSTGSFCGCSPALSLLLLSASACGPLPRLRRHQVAHAPTAACSCYFLLQRTQKERSASPWGETVTFSPWAWGRTGELCHRAQATEVWNMWGREQQYRRRCLGWAGQPGVCRQETLWKSTHLFNVHPWAGGECGREEA